jgi:hypothetical protein
VPSTQGTGIDEKFMNVEAGLAQEFNAFDFHSGGVGFLFVQDLDTPRFLRGFSPVPPRKYRVGVLYYATAASFHSISYSLFSDNQSH